MKGKEASEVELWHDGGWQVIEFSGLIAKMISTTIMSLPRITGRKDMGGVLSWQGGQFRGFVCAMPSPQLRDQCSDGEVGSTKC